MNAIVQAAIWSAAATLLVFALSKLWRRTDAALWHGVWTAIAAASLVLPLANLVLPRTQVSFAGEGPVGRELESWATGFAASDLVLVVYAIGVAWCLLRLASGVLLVQRLCRRSLVVEGLPQTRLRQFIGAASGVVRTHRRVQVPLTAGWRAPVVLLPETWLTWESERLTAVLRHELAHVARRDYAWNIVAACFHALYWFSPAAWIVTRNIRLTAELAADRWASDEMGRVPYARILIESARELLRGRRAGMLAPSAATVLEARVAALTGMPDDAPSSSSRARRLAIVVIVVALLASAFVRLGVGLSTPVPADHQARHAAQHLKH